MLKKKGVLFIFLFIIISISTLGCDLKGIIKDEKCGQIEDQMKVHYIDVGQGDSILVQVNNKNLLIDAGPRESKDKLINYLDKIDIKKLDYVIATHPHEDHIGRDRKSVV